MGYVRGGLDDALDKLARRDELRRRAAGEATGTTPAVTELVEAIAGLRRVSAGWVRLAGAGGTLRDVTHASVRERADAGLSHIPEDRHARGLVLDYTVADNLILGLQHHFSRRGRLERDRRLAGRHEADEDERRLQRRDHPIRSV
jgi:ABC-type uncharacterized transport system ATPase subunit